MNKKISIALVFFIIVLVGGLLTFLFLIGERNQVMTSEVSILVKEKNTSKIVDEIDVIDWKTYRNTAYNYELKYPANWEIGTTFGADPQTFSAPNFSPNNCFDSDACPSFAIGNVHEIAENEIIEKEITLNSDDRLISKGEIEISGEKAFFVEYYQTNYGRRDGEMGLVRQELSIIHNNTMYRFYIDEYNSDINKIKTSADWRYKKVFEHMLASFVFIETEKQNSISASENSSQIVAGEDALVSALSDKYNKDEDEVTITISKEYGNFVRGGVEFEPGGQGNSGMFLAVNMDGNWTIVYDGNGAPDCDKLENNYGFSQEMLSGICY